MLPHECGLRLNSRKQPPDPVLDIDGAVRHPGLNNQGIATVH